MNKQFRIITANLLAILLMFTSCSAQSQNEKYTAIGNFFIAGSYDSYSLRDTKEFYLSYEAVLDKSVLEQYKIEKPESENYYIGTVKINSSNGRMLTQKGFAQLYLKDQNIIIKGGINTYNWNGTEPYVLEDSLKLKGYFTFKNKTDSIPVEINLSILNRLFRHYEVLASGKMETSLKLKFNPNTIKSFKAIKLNYVNELQSGIPDELAQYTGIEALVLNGILNEPVPEFIFKFENLERLVITPAGDYSWVNEEQKAYHYFTVPLGVFGMKNLKLLKLDQFNLYIPDSIPYNDQIEELDFINCYFKEFPSSIVNIKNLKRLILGGAGEYKAPANLNQLEKLEELSIYIKDGEIPEGFGPWPHLKSLKIVTKTKLEQEKIDKIIKDHPNAELIKINGVKHICTEKGRRLELGLHDKNSLIFKHSVYPATF